MAELTKRDPEHIFIHLGSDDILWPTENPTTYSLKNYAKLIGMIKEKLPQAKITLLSVTPVTVKAEELEPRYKNINDYNEGLKELAEKRTLDMLICPRYFQTARMICTTRTGFILNPSFTQECWTC